MPTAHTESRAHLVLRSSPVRALRDLFVEETETTVILRGIVFSYYQKQQALEAIKPLLAGRSLLNHVEVQCPE
jgi:hypothetical protein